MEKIIWKQTGDIPSSHEMGLLMDDVLEELNEDYYDLKEVDADNIESKANKEQAIVEFLNSSTVDDIIQNKLEERNNCELFEILEGLGFKLKYFDYGDFEFEVCREIADLITFDIKNDEEAEVDDR